VTSIPHQLCRWIANEGKNHGLSNEDADAQFTAKLRRFWYDTCLYTQGARLAC
jgi:hypothetical protein